jgi:phospholipid/cholesterol/gamma-HCH transport system substrate-binding protein
VRFLDTRSRKLGLAAALVVLLVAGLVAVVDKGGARDRVTVVGYFANSNGIYAGDDVVVLGVPIGTVEKIEPQPEHVKITFGFDPKYKVPADAKAVVLSPALVTARSIQLTPAYSGGPTLANGAVIPQERTAVPVEFDEFRDQLQKLAGALQPTEPGGVSTLGSFINTAADNLRGQGEHIRQTLIEVSQAFSALGDNSQNLFGTVKNLAVLVSALHDSSDVLAQLNQNLAATTGLLTNGQNEVGNAMHDLGDVVGDVGNFVSENRETLGTTTEKLAAVSQVLTDNLDEIKQLLHVAPNSFQNFINIYQPAQGTLTGALALNNFADPVQFLCGAIQAASRMGAEQSAKLCAQYLAPIIKNRQYNFLPFGLNPFVGATARPNEITYSEDWLRPDYVPPAGPGAPPQAAPGAPPLPAELGAGSPPDAPPPVTPLPPAPVPTDPTNGLSGLMVPPGGGQ